MTDVLFKGGRMLKKRKRKGEEIRGEDMRGEENLGENIGGGSLSNRFGNTGTHRTNQGTHVWGRPIT